MLLPWSCCRCYMLSGTRLARPCRSGCVELLRAVHCLVLLPWSNCRCCMLSDTRLCRYGCAELLRVVRRLVLLPWSCCRRYMLSGTRLCRSGCVELLRAVHWLVLLPWSCYRCCMLSDTRLCRSGCVELLRAVHWLVLLPWSSCRCCMLSGTRLCRSGCMELLRAMRRLVCLSWCCCCRCCMLVSRRWDTDSGPWHHNAGVAGIVRLRRVVGVLYNIAVRGSGNNDRSRCTVNELAFFRCRYLATIAIAVVLVQCWIALPIEPLCRACHLGCSLLPIRHSLCLTEFVLAGKKNRFASTRHGTFFSSTRFVEKRLKK